LLPITFIYYHIYCQIQNCINLLHGKRIIPSTKENITTFAPLFFGLILCFQHANKNNRKGGGYSMAAGLTVRREKLAELRSFLEQHMSQSVNQSRSNEKLLIDGALTA